MKRMLLQGRNLAIGVALTVSAAFGSFQVFAGPAGPGIAELACTPCGGCGSTNGGVWIDYRCYCCNPPVATPPPAM